MANIRLIVPHIKRWEGGYVCHPNDRGGCTNMGVTLATYRSFYGVKKTCADLQGLTEREWIHIFRAGYWDALKADRIENDSLALLCVDWCYMSGTKNAITRIQTAIGTTPDGIVGSKTLAILNGMPMECFAKIWNARYFHFKSIVERNPSQGVFLKGWLNRLNSIKYKDNG